MNQKRAILLILAGFLVLFLIYYIFLYAKKCDNQECFNSHLYLCSKATYLDDKEDGTWFYSIKGKELGSCLVNVKLLQAKKGAAGLEKIEGYDMDCYLALGYVVQPQADLSFCHGRLKEEIQDMLIQKMHSYILSNLGTIGEELKKIV